MGIWTVSVCVYESSPSFQPGSLLLFSGQKSSLLGWPGVQFCVSVCETMRVCVCVCGGAGSALPFFGPNQKQREWKETSWATTLNKSYNSSSAACAHQHVGICVFTCVCVCVCGNMCLRVLHSQQIREHMLCVSCVFLTLTLWLTAAFQVWKTITGQKRASGRKETGLYFYNHTFVAAPISCSPYGFSTKRLF